MINDWRLQRPGMAGIWLAGLSVFVAGCANQRLSSGGEPAEKLYANYYQSERISSEIERSFESVIRIQATVFYRTYPFNPDDYPMEGELSNVDFSDITEDSFMENNSTAGTAVVLPGTRDVPLLLTASHIVSFPDTVFHYAAGLSGAGGRAVEAVSVAENIGYYTFENGEMLVYEVAQNDPGRDLALMTVREDFRNRANLTPLRTPAGKSARLNWGDIVYALGYPKGVQMVTQGVVSKMPVFSDKGFVIDASFNRGFSGGVIFALRQDGSGFDWVGLLSSASADHEEFLTPEYIGEEEFQPDIPYRGEMYVNRTMRVNYGITHAVGIDEIADFLEENSAAIRRLGVRVQEIL